MQLQKLTLLTVGVVIFLIGYLVGQGNFVRLIPEPDPRRTVQRELITIKNDMARSGLTSVEFDGVATHFHETAEKYVRAITSLEQFERRKNRRACLAEAIAAFDQTSVRWHQLDSCAQVEVCTGPARADLQTAMGISEKKLDECLKLFERKN
jgi:hypothetical protein